VDAASPEASRPGPGYSRAAPNGRGVSPRADQRDRRLTRLIRFVQHLAAPRCSRVPGCAVGADQLDPPDKVEPPGPAPWRHADHPKRTALHALERVRQLRVAWSERMRTDAGSEVPDQRSAPGRHLKARSIVQLAVGATYAQQREVDQACAVGTRALDLPADQRIGPITQRAQDLLRELEPWRGRPAVKDLRERVMAS
jgi:hypothetical protein